MSRYIDADALIEDFRYCGADEGLIKAIIHRVNLAPTADVVEVRHGEWKTPTTINGRAFNVPHCSVCEGIPCGVDENTKFCPNCGAKMDGERRSENEG